ncbi:MAG: OmpA family protein [Phycisphaerales bacterium]|nr:OmpA family protein [Phycisphaerales bacterium]
MARKFVRLGMVVALPVLSATVGCADQLKAKDAQIALIEDQNQRLTDELGAAQRRADEMTRGRQHCDQELAAARNQINSLRDQLNNVPEQAAPEGWTAVPGGAMIAIEDEVLFASGKAVLRDTGKAKLDSVTSTIGSQYPTKDVYVFGHTDDMPIRKSGWKDNYELSTQRALTVVRHLQQQGIEGARLVACGAGEYRPRVPNTNDDSRMKNRRVEIYAVDPIK